MKTKFPFIPAKRYLKQIVSSTSFLTIVLSMISVVFNLYVSLRILDITGSPAKQTLALFAYNAGYTFMSFIWRHVELGNRFIKALFVLLSGTLIPIFAFVSFSENFYVILVSFVLFSFSLAILNPLTVNLISRRVKRESEISLKYNYYNSLGSTIGYLLAGAFTGVINLGFLILILAVVFLVNVISIRGEVEYGVPKILTGPLPHHHSFHINIDVVDKLIHIRYDVFYLRLFLRRLSINIKRRHFLTLLGIFVFFIAVGLFFTPLPSMLILTGLTKKEIYIEYAFFNLFSIIGYQSISSLNLTFEKMYSVLSLATLARCILFVLPSLLFIGLVEPNLWFITTIMILVGYTWAFLGTTMLGILLSLVPHNDRARAASSLNALSSLGTVIGSLLSTLIVTKYSVGYAYIASGIIAMIALMLFIKARSAILS
jgi:MFS family permease